MRVTQLMMDQMAVNGLRRSIGNLADTQKKSTTTKQISLPHDDPFGTEQALGFRSQINESEQNLNSIALGLDWIYTTDSALSDTSDLLTQAKSLAIRGSSESLGSGERQSIAAAVDGLIEQMVTSANTRNGDYYIFSGYQVNTAPFEVTRDATTNEITGVTYNGDSGIILRQVDGTSTVDLNFPGDSLYNDIFTHMINLRDNLLAEPFDPEAVTTSMDNLDAQADRIIEKEAIVGSKAARLNSAQTFLESNITNLKSLDSQVEDADMAEVLTDLAQQQSIYQTALQVNAQILRLSLLDYLK